MNNTSYNYSRYLNCTISPALKYALIGIAEQQEMGLSTLVRMALLDYMPRVYPGFTAMYQKGKSIFANQANGELPQPPDAIDTTIDAEPDGFVEDYVEDTGYDDTNRNINY